jgi:hypothetical protein
MEETVEESESYAQSLEDAGDSEIEVPASQLQDTPVEPEPVADEEAEKEAPADVKADDVQEDSPAEEVKADDAVEPDHAPNPDTNKLKDKDPEFKGVVQALNKEREARRGTELQLAKMQEQLEKLTQAPPEQEPDRDLDPDAFADYHKRRADAAIDQQTKADKGLADQQEFDKVTRYATEKVAEFMVDHPDYPSQFNFVREKVIADLVQSGRYSAETAPQQFDVLAAQASQDIYNNQGNPAQYVSQQAMQMGYKPAGAAVAPDGKGNSDAAMKDAERLQKGRDTSRNLGKGGGAGNSALTPETIKGKQGTEFDNSYDAWSAGVTGHSDSIE